MADWETALSALAANTPDEEAQKKKEEVARSKRTGVVYSTNPDFTHKEDSAEEIPTLPKNQQRLRLAMERAGRGGKTVTIVRGFTGTETDLQSLGKMLKQRCGVGGSVKNGEIIIQGDHHPRILEILRQEGYTQSK